MAKTKPHVVITRPSGPYAGAERMAEQLRERGFEPVEFPVLTCVPREPSSETIVRLGQLASDASVMWLAFLSPTAVVVWSALAERFQVMKTIQGKARLAAQGSGTAKACEEHFGRSPDFVPSVFVAEEFARELCEIVSTSDRVLVPQSAEGRDMLAPTLAIRGVRAESFQLYGLEVVTPPAELFTRLGLLPDETTAVVFMSPSAVRAAMRVAGDAIRRKRVVSVGPITSQEIRLFGLSVWAEAREHSEKGVLEVLDSLLLR